jgi:hypothetical protein
MSINGGGKRKVADSYEVDYDDLNLPALRKQCKKYGLSDDGPRDALLTRLTFGGGSGKRVQLASSDVVLAPPDKSELECDICMVLMGGKIFLVTPPLFPHPHPSENFLGPVHVINFNILYSNSVPSATLCVRNATRSWTSARHATASTTRASLHVTSPLSQLQLRYDRG